MNRYESAGPAGTPGATPSVPGPGTTDSAGMPVDVLDRLLWRDAQQMLERHSGAGPDGRCDWCGWHWPCPPRRLAERAEIASRRPWRESWTARHELNGLRTLPSWRAERGPMPSGHNGGSFD